MRSSRLVPSRTAMNVIYQGRRTKFFFVDPLPCMLKMYSLEVAMEISYPEGPCIQVPENF